MMKYLRKYNDWFDEHVALLDPSVLDSHKKAHPDCEVCLWGPLIITSAFVVFVSAILWFLVS